MLGKVAHIVSVVLIAGWGVCATAGKPLYAQNEPHEQDADSWSEGREEVEKLMRKAGRALRFKEYERARNLLEQAYEIDRNYAPLNAELGYVYAKLGQPYKALERLRTAAKQNALPTEYAETYAELLLIDRAFGQAKSWFERAASQYEAGTPAYNRLIARAAQAKNGQELLQQPVTNIVVTRLPDSINSRWAELNPRISPDGSTLYFSAERPENAGGVTAAGYYYEDIYTAARTDSGWRAAQNIGTPLNTNGHDAPLWLSVDGQQMLLYQQSGNGDIYTSRLNGNRWSDPEKLPKPINSRHREVGATMDLSGSRIFFASDRPGGYGGLDLYYSYRLGKNQWAEPINLGAGINTPSDETAPFLHPVGRQLYFASDGHNAMGGLDLFISRRKTDSLWAPARNMGFPLNSAADDAFFSLTGDGRYGYFASNRIGTRGSMDIFRVEFLPPEPADTDDTPLAVRDSNLASAADTAAPPPPDTTTLPLQPDRMVLVRGQVTDAKGGQPVGANVTVLNLANNDTVAKLNANTATGNYLITLPVGQNYAVVVEAEDYVFYSENFDLPAEQAFEEKVIDIKLEPAEVGGKTVLRNVFFELASAELKKTSQTELDRLLNTLQQNPDMRVRIIGHTDEQGPAELNRQLSEKRAEAVVRYLISNGISAERLQAVGKGESEPLVDEATEEAYARNRRVEFEIIED